MIQRYEFIRIFAENKSERRVCKKAKESAISRKQEHCDLKPETRQQTKTLINKGLYEDKPYRFGRTAAAARPDGRCDRSGIPADVQKVRSRHGVHRIREIGRASCRERV